MNRSIATTLFLLLIATSVLSQTAAPITALPDGVKLQVKATEDIIQDHLSKNNTVRLLVTKNLRGPDGSVVIPENAVATARVLETEQPKKKNPAKLLLVVEKAKWKGGELPLHAYIVSPIMQSPSASVSPQTAGTQDDVGTIGFEPHAQAGSYLYSHWSIKMPAGTTFMVEQMSAPGPAVKPIRGE